ncbi:MAG: hypothetical protein ABI831_18865, partial [Betaproteobacteria bacterium]
MRGVFFQRVEIQFPPDRPRAGIGISLWSSRSEPRSRLLWSQNLALKNEGSACQSLTNRLSCDFAVEKVLAGQPPKSGSNLPGMLDVTRQPATFAALDGCPISGHWYVPVGAQPKSLAVVACGGGIPARMYQAMARYLAGKGTIILTFDYRGIGESRNGSLRGF